MLQKTKFLSDIPSELLDTDNRLLNDEDDLEEDKIIEEELRLNLKTVQ